MKVLVVAGLQRECRLLAGPGIETLAGGGDSARLEEEAARLAAGVDGIVSLGIAGGLAPGLSAGDWVVADAVVDRGTTVATDAGWTARLAAALPEARRGPVLGQDGVAATAAEKAALHRATGALAVDMESHVAARVARRHGRPFAVARVLSDGADRTLPPAARVGLGADGAVDLAAVLRSLAAAPWQLPALLRTGLEAGRAFRALEWFASTSKRSCFYFGSADLQVRSSS
ncbi:phosphorylase [Reyranella sp.]|uniref:phosphorylase family protein n=1 Tax=Reyranella sp. TaxID=1929291 RepID=UPI003BAAE802